MNSTTNASQNGIGIMLGINNVCYNGIKLNTTQSDNFNKIDH